ncbi:hypothetical protein NM96060_2251, partial [Neisseria meningitidis 96060]
IKPLHWLELRGFTRIKNMRPLWSAIYKVLSCCFGFLFFVEITRF